MCLDGQWHCSQVWRAGRKFSIGEWIGRLKVFKVVEMTWRRPSTLAFTNQEAPGPMWHWTQATRECGEPW